ncbi:MAG: hypothetical protein A2Z25_23535 [Planctomycetes bacterium RBG_16_55_9]|nr:MAG: hypothetical protein A2Z25_23535 [Planctomycetes bacterium RBG_16_55_9]
MVSEGKHEQSGALENLLKRLGATQASFLFDKVSNRAIHAFHGKGPGYFKRAIRWLKEAENRQVDALVFLIDEDGKSERIAQIRNAQDSLVSRLPRAMGVAIRTFDAWMLPDEKTLSQVLGYNVNRQHDPETILNPKQVCKDLLTKSQNRLAQREMYKAISHEIDIDILCDRCPSGFKPFAAAVRNIFQ